MHRFDKENGVCIEMIGSIHEGGTIHDSPIKVEDNRVINPDQRIINPITINLHVHVNELSEGIEADGLIAKIIGRFYNAITKKRHESIENIGELSIHDIQRCLVRESED
jgi:hypothetical protein